MTRRAPDCRDIAYNSTILFENYMRNAKEDSAQALLVYWESKCSMNEFLQRAKILFSLEYSSFNDSILDSNIVRYLLSFVDRMNYRIDNRENYDKNIFKSYDDFTLTLAANLISKYKDGTIEYFLCRIYNNSLDSIFKEIQKPEYRSSKIYRQYLEEVNKCRKLSEVNCAGVIGLWIPTAAASKLGNHPELGFQVGFRKYSMMYDLTLAFRFLNTPTTYLAKHVQTTGNLEPTTHFLGGYFGIDVGHILYQTNHNEFHLLAGAGYDGFDVFPNENNHSNTSSPSVSSYNFNFGVGARYYFGKSTYIGLQIKYNIVDYTLNHIVDFTGNAYTIRLIVGGITGWRRNCMERLQQSR